MKNIIIVVIAGLIVAGAVLSYQYIWVPRQQELSPQKLPLAEEKATPAPQTPTSTPKGETADWKVYKNEKYGFSLTFPDSWIGLKSKNRVLNFGTFGTSDSIDFGFPAQESLFNICFLTKNQWQKIKSEEGPKPVYLGENNKYVFAYAKAQDAANETIDKRMKEIPFIVATFKLLTNDETADTPTLESIPTPPFASIPTPTSTSPTTVEYRNNQYGFKFALPASWKGHSIVTTEWEGYTLDGPQGDVTIERDPMISIRHPQWTSQNPRQDIPIMVLTVSQWNSLEQGEFHIDAAPVNPTELGRNSKYVFALPARYNYAFPTGYEEVEKILRDRPLQAF